MLTITIPAVEGFDPIAEEFVYSKEVTIKLEHSLVAISKWESKYKKAFIGNDLRSSWEETVYYVMCMTITQNVKPEVYMNLSHQNIKDIAAYIEDDMTATTIRQVHKSGGREIVTSEVIYTWMVMLRVPFETQKWHLNRLLTLISVCNAKSNPPKKMSKAEILKRNHDLNEARRKKMNTTG